MSKIKWYEKLLIPTYDFTDEIQPGIVTINDNCTGCGICVKICPACSLELKNKKSELKHQGDCIFCGCCQAICPKDAVVMLKPPQFKYYYKTIDRGEAKSPRINY